MLIEINGKVTELTRVTGINTKLDPVSVGDIGSANILMKIPYKYVPEVHDPILETIFAEYWKSMWNPYNIEEQPEAGSWEVGISVSAVVDAYISYFISTYWNIGRRNICQVSFTGCESSGDGNASLSSVDVYGTTDVRGIVSLLQSGNLDKGKFAERYHAWLETNPDVDYRLDVDAGSNNGVLEGIDPCVWECLLLSSRALMKEAGEEPDLVAVFTKFLNESKAVLMSSIYTLTPSERKLIEEAND